MFPTLVAGSAPARRRLCTSLPSGTRFHSQDRACHRHCRIRSSSHPVLLPCVGTIPWIWKPSRRTSNAGWQHHSRDLSGIPKTVRRHFFSRAGRGISPDGARDVFERAVAQRRTGGIDRGTGQPGQCLRLHRFGRSAFRRPRAMFRIRPEAFLSRKRQPARRRRSAGRHRRLHDAGQCGAASVPADT
jgi:hypothetical protein